MDNKNITYSVFINNTRTVHANKDETILQAALRAGIEFPNLCRVGGCGTCKCRLLDGEVIEMTETGYILSEKEISQGYILACQSKAKSDIKIYANMSAVIKTELITGKVINKELLTADIARLDVLLSKNINFRAGQFANLILPDYPNDPRSYSFSSPPNDDGIVSFTIKEVAGGKISSKLMRETKIGDEISIQFHLILPAGRKTKSCNCSKLDRLKVHCLEVVFSDAPFQPTNRFIFN